jgi:C-terminal processing protease CtpA/Prc
MQNAGSPGIRMKLRASLLSVAIVVGIIAFTVMSSFVRHAHADEKYGDYERQVVLAMLKETEKDVQNHYYDATFHGVDMTARFRAAEANIEVVHSYREAIGQIEWVLQGLNDSHTVFIPPPQPFDIDYGFEFEFYGNNCYVTHVRPGTDAEAAGLRAGDRIVAIDGEKLARPQFLGLLFSLRVIAPRTKLSLTLVRTDGAQQELTIKPKVHWFSVRTDTSGTQHDAFNINWYLRRLEDVRRYEESQAAVVGDVMIWRLPNFTFPEKEAEARLRQARKCRALILDLRGNEGGTTKNLEWLIGATFNHDVKAWDRVSRGDTESEVVRTHGENAFTRALFVLVDSKSRSAAEIYARVVQLGKRGIVMGDRTAGRAMEANLYPHDTTPAEIGRFPINPYVVKVSVAELIMQDGKTIEHVGVTPDLLVLPTPADLAADKDPVLSAAISLAGQQVDPLAAGKLIPFRWPPTGN